MLTTQASLISYLHAKRWLGLFIVLHLLCWTLLPTIVRDNLPLDAIEGTIWGHQLEWGYDKNPFMNGWLTALAIHLDGQSGWMLYLFSQVSVGLCFWVIWQLAKTMLPPAYALISVMILEGVQYYNFHAIDFNDNTLELGLWGLTIYFFYRSLRSPTHLSWLLTGLFAGFGMMAKYYTVTLLAGMALLLLLHRDHRKQLTTLSPYLGLTVFLAVLLPHIIWLFFHDFITITYVFERGSSAPSWTNHFFFPAQFAWQQLQAFLPACILLSLLLLGKKPRLAPQPFKLATFDKAFLFYVGLGPFLLTLLLSLLMGTKLRAGWGMPLLSLWGIILVALVQPHLTKAKINGFLASIFILMGILLTGYALSLTNSSTTSSANFPGRDIANIITKEWRDTYHTKLDYVAGSRWVGGNIGFYSSDHPTVFIEWDKRRAPWIDVKEMQKKGGVFVWEITRHETMPENIRQWYPQLLETKVMEFNWRRNKNNLPPVKIGVAMLPPQV
jgi:4-amino-4-deoxy-L-arabinose transferase-like glycosyltransferase